MKSFGPPLVSGVSAIGLGIVTKNLTVGVVDLMVIPIAPIAPAPQLSAN